MYTMKKHDDNNPYLPGTAAWAIRRTVISETAKYGHAPTTTIFGRDCTVCGRRTVADANGRRHVGES